MEVLNAFMRAVADYWNAKMAVTWKEGQAGHAFLRRGFHALRYTLYIYPMHNADIRRAIFQKSLRCAIRGDRGIYFCLRASQLIVTWR